MLFRPHERAELKDQLTIIKVGIALFVAVTLICAALVAIPLWEALVESLGSEQYQSILADCNRLKQASDRQACYARLPSKE
jgi:hypothetical protein